MALLGFNVPPDMQEALNDIAAGQGEPPPAYVGAWAPAREGKRDMAATAPEAIPDADFTPLGDVGKAPKQKPPADFVPGQELIQEDAGRKAKFAPAPEDLEQAFDPSKLPMRTIRGGTPNYLDTKWRVLWFRKEHPDGSIIATPVQVTDKFAFFSAEVFWQDGEGQAHSCRAHGSETPNDFPDFIEKAETKAIGRALALAGFGAQFMPDDAQVVDSPVDRRPTPPQDARKAPQGNAGPAQAPTPQNGVTDAQRAEMSAMQKKLLEEVRRIGASPSRMQAISEEVTTVRDARKLKAPQLRDLLDTLKDVADNTFTPDEVFAPDAEGS